MDYVQDQGRACYKRGEYDKAIEHFDRAIGHNPSVQLLDNRAACYEKLGQLHKALKDAKSAIHQQREDPTGYLRAGKVLMKMEKPTVALEIYNHGLRSIKHVGKGYEVCIERITCSKFILTTISASSQSTQRSSRPSVTTKKCRSHDGPSA